MLTILYGVYAYPTGSLTRSRNLLNFQYPVATLQSAVLVRALKFFFVGLDACQGYHQVQVRKIYK